MATERRAKPLTPEEVEAYCEALRQKDLKYAGDLDLAQSTFLKNKPRIKNWQEFKTIEDVKRAMIGLHEKVEHTGAIEVNITKKVVNDGASD